MQYADTYEACIYDACMCDACQKWGRTDRRKNQPTNEQGDSRSRMILDPDACVYDAGMKCAYICDL